MVEILITENQSVITFADINASYENSIICELLETAAEAGVSVDMIAQSPATSDKISFGFTVQDSDMTALLPSVTKLALPLVNSGNVKVTVKSDEMVGHFGFAAKVFAVLKELDCRPLLITTGIDEISLLVRQCDRIDLERELRNVFGK